MIDFKLYAITDRHQCAPTPLVDVVSELLDAGITAIQLREKDLSDTELMRLAQPIAELCRNYEAKLFINTNTDIALEVGASGRSSASKCRIGREGKSTNRGQPLCRVFGAQS